MPADGVIKRQRTTPLTNAWDRMSVPYYEAKNLPIAPLDQGGQLQDPARAKLVNRHMTGKYLTKDPVPLVEGFRVASGWLGIPWGREEQLRREFDELPLDTQAIIAAGSEPRQLVQSPLKMAPKLP